MMDNNSFVNDLLDRYLTKHLHKIHTRTKVKYEDTYILYMNILFKFFSKKKVSAEKGP